VRKKQNSKFQDLLIGRKQNISKFLIGSLKDSDKDRVPNWIDCNPFNPNQHANIPQQLQQQRPQAQPTKQPTLTEQKLIQQYGSLEAAKQQQQYQKLVSQQQEYQSKNEQQKQNLQSEINKLKKEINKADELQSTAAAKSVRRYNQARAKELRAKLGVLNQALSGLQQGGYYENVQDIYKSADKYGSAVYTAEQREFKLSDQGRQPIKEKISIPKTGGYFIDPKTGQGFSSAQDLTKKGYIRTATPEDIRTNKLVSSGGVVYGQSGVQEYDKAVQKLREKITKQSLKDVPISEGGMEGELQPAPTIGERYRETAEREGYVKGTLSFVGSEVSNLVWRGQERAVRKYGGSYDPQMAELTGKTASIAPYFIPYVGTGLLIAGGVEEIGTTAGRKRIAQQRESMIQEGYNPPFSTAVSYGRPVAEIGLGLYGLKGEIRATQTRRALKSPQTEFIAKEVPKGDYSDVFVVSKTSYPKGRQIKFPSGKVKQVSYVDDAYGVSAQRVFSKGDDAAGLSRGYIIQPKGRQIKFPSGKVKELTKIDDIRGVGFSQRQVGEGVKIKSISVVKGEEPIKQTLIGSVKRAEQYGDDVFSFVGGTPKTRRIYKTGRVTETAKPSVKGLIKRTTEPSTQQYFISPQPSGITPKVQESVTSQVSSLITGATTRAETTTGFKSFFNIIPSVSAQETQRPQITQQKAETKQATNLIYPSLTKIETRQTQKTMPISKTKTETTTQTSQNLAGLITPRLDTSEITRQDQIRTPIEITSPRLDTEQKEGIKQVPTLTTGFFSGEPIPIRPGIPIPPIFLDKKKKEETGQAYDVFVKLDSTKPRKKRWVKVADNVSKEAALGFGAKAVDTTLSSQFKIVKDKGEVKPTKNPFWSQLGYKFRNYMIRKGNKIQQTNRYIEKTKYRLDTPNEKGKIQRARMSSLIIGRRR